MHAHTHTLTHTQLIFVRYQITCGTRERRHWWASWMCDLCALPALLYLTQESKTLYHETSANMHHRGCYCIVNNVAFTKGNFSNHQKLKLDCLNNCVMSNWLKSHQQKEQKKQHYYQYARSCRFLKQRKKETKSNIIISMPGAVGFWSKERNQKHLTWSTFCKFRLIQQKSISQKMDNSVKKNPQHIQL